MPPLSKLVLTALLSGLLFGSSVCAAPPPQARGKTVQFTYTVSVPTKLPDGSIKTTSRTEHRTIYISSAGRAFMRNARRNSANETDKVEQGPEGTSSSLQFSGNTLVGRVGDIVGAYQFTLRFDPSFQSCTADMIFGRAAGEAHHKWKSVGGRVLKSAGKGSVSTSCSVSSGNEL